MEILIIIVLLAIAVETTYLTVTSLQKNGRIFQSPAFVDTSVLIDGRIVAIAESGFISRPLYIPRSVVGELQFLADNADSEKRTRARHGLDVISELQAIKTVTVQIFNDGTRATDGVDNRLLELAKRHNGAVCTIDYNLNKVAVVEGIEVLNVNELAKSLRMAYLPGEKTFIELTQKGNDNHQGIGHLSDGTMVVVEHAYKQIGSKVEIEFIRGIQTAAGKMMFAKLVGGSEKANTQNNAKPASKPVGRKAPVKPTEPQQRSSRAPKQQQQPQQAQQSSKPVAQPVRTRKPARATQQQQAPKPTQEPAKPATHPRRNNRRRTPEDSMVELANRSQE